MKLLTADQSRELDRLSQARFGVPSYSLMTRAGEAVAASLARRFPDALAAGVLVVAGKGNNGGDGLVAARALMQRDAVVQVALLARRDALKGDAARALSDYESCGAKVIEIGSEAQLRAVFERRFGAIIDAIFGTGLNAAVAGLPALAIELINAANTAVIAVDIASGVNSDTGAIMGAAVKASATVTFGLAKYGHVSDPGAELCGALEIADIGFAPDALAEIAPRGRFIEADDVRPLLRPRPTNAHKGQFGHPLIIAGSRGKSGAVLLAARGALRMGAGLVTAAIPDSIAAVVASGQAELMTEPLPDRDGHFDAACARRLAGIIPSHNAIAFGCGVGVSDDTRALLSMLVTEATDQHRPLLIDADGLNALASMGVELLRQARGPVVLTPHPGEMARLLDRTTAQINADRISAARRLSELTRAHVLLKGARTVIASPDGVVHINSTGNPGMATPGMGDALSGIIAALLGQQFAPLDAISLGAFIHGCAADRVAQHIGPLGYLTGDLIDELPRALAALSSK